MGDIIYVDFTKTVKENLLRSKEEYEKLRTERSQTFMLATDHETEVYSRVGPYKPTAVPVEWISPEEAVQSFLNALFQQDENK